MKTLGYKLTENKFVYLHSQKNAVIFTSVSSEAGRNLPE